LRRVRNPLADYTALRQRCQGFRAPVLDRFSTISVHPYTTHPPGAAGCLHKPGYGAGRGLTFENAGFMMNCPGGYCGLRRITDR
jgi:hypothetical protein